MPPKKGSTAPATISISPRSHELLSQFTSAYSLHELNATGSTIAMEDVFKASYDQILQAALKIAIAQVHRVNAATAQPADAPAVDPHAAAHAKHQAAIVARFPAPVENDATNE